MHAMKLTKTKAGGGTWYHGFEGGFVKSNYNHTKKTHKSSAAAGQRFFESKWKKKMKGIPTLQWQRLFSETRLFGIQNKENNSKVIL